MKLIICGNGFDRGHGLSTGYWHYQEHLKRNASHVLSDYTNFSWLNEACKGNLWRNVEDSLCINFHKMIDHYINYYSDAEGEIEYKTNFDKWTRFIYSFTGGEFYKWLLSVDLSVAKKKDELVSLFSNAVFVTFNYTDTLEKVYGIDENKVLHLHGRLIKVKEENCFGSSVIPTFRTIEEAENCDGPIIEHDKWNNDIIRNEIQFGAPITSEEQLKNLTAGVKRESLKKALRELADKSTKKIYENLSALESFLNQYEIDEIIIIGHSLLGADDFYYSNCFVEHFQGKKWIAYWHKENDKDLSDRDEKSTFFSHYSITNIELREW